jgi:outer membrane protein assembly factor BamD (BamD/ComL family)
MMKNMKIYLPLFLAVIALTMTACKPSREKSVEQIRTLEQKLFSPESDGFDKVRADSLLNHYKEFIDRFPKDSLTPGYLFRSANIAMNAGNGLVAVEQFDRYMQDFPDGKNAPLCLFFKAFVYENVLKNLDKARETYLLFIERYPGNTFVKDAEMALRNLGKTPDQIVREFEEQRRADSLRVADSIAAVKKAKPRKR